MNTSYCHSSLRAGLDLEKLFFQGSLAKAQWWHILEQNVICVLAPGQQFNLFLAVSLFPVFTFIYAISLSLLLPSLFIWSLPTFIHPDQIHSWGTWAVWEENDRIRQNVWHSGARSSMYKAAWSRENKMDSTDNLVWNLMSFWESVGRWDQGARHFVLWKPFSYTTVVSSLNCV